MDDLQKLVDKIATKLFCSGQMDAQGSVAEKRKIGAGGPVLAMSRRLYAEATDELAALLAQREASDGDNFLAFVEALRADDPARELLREWREYNTPEPPGKGEPPW